MSKAIERLCPSAKAEELVESFINGNLTWVCEELDAWPQEFSMAVVAYMMDQLKAIETTRGAARSQGGYSSYHTGSFLRLLSNRL